MRRRATLLLILVVCVSASGCLRKPAETMPAGNAEPAEAPPKPAPRPAPPPTPEPPQPPPSDDPHSTQPRRDLTARRALALAWRLDVPGWQARTRRHFARAWLQQPAAKERWLRSLALESEAYQPWCRLPRCS